MSVVSVKARSFILALFIRDDGERFLLGDNGYEFKDSQLHFAANTIENDEVMKQGADGVMVAGQVRRASVQSFDGFVGDATMAKETIEQMRRDFFAFFIKGHHFRVVYIDCNRNAWQRKGGYLVDAPEVKELWQIHPEYHVGLNFEDVNYYSYDEDADGNEILANLVNVPVSTEVSGGLVWDEDGAVSEDAGDISYDAETADATPAKNVYITDAAEAPLASFRLDGETSQNGTPTPDAPVAVQTVTGENVVKICGKNLFNINGSFQQGFLGNNGNISYSVESVTCIDYIEVKQNTTYAISYSAAVSGSMFRGVCFYDANKAFISRRTSSSGLPDSFTTPSNTRYMRVYFYNADGMTVEQLPSYITNIQIELGSTATAYEPYQSQSYEVNLGKNLFDKDNANIFNGYLGTGGIVEAANARAIYIPVVAGQTYTFSRANSTSQVNDPYYAFIANEPAAGGQYLEGRHAVGQNDLTFTGTAPTGSKYLIFYFAWNPNAETLATILSTYQLELGSQATSYADYFTPIELCKIGDYQDYIYKSGGKWYVHKEVGKAVLDGSESDWTRGALNGNTTYRFFVTISGIKTTQSANSLGLVLSDKLVEITNGSQYSGTEGIRVRSNGAEQLAISTYATQTMTVDNFQTWLAANNIIAYYVLATPTDTEITNETLIEQLEAVLGGHTYAGTNNITTITPNEQGTLEISYYTKYQPMVVGGGYVWEAGGSGGATIVVNNSIDNVNPIWKIYGPTMNPQLENSTTGEVIEYVGLIAEGQTLTIDMGEQTASLEGLNVISNLVGDFVSLAPGANRLIYSVSGDAGASEIGWSEIVG